MYNHVCGTNFTLKNSKINYERGKRSYKNVTYMEFSNIDFEWLNSKIHHRSTRFCTLFQCVFFWPPNRIILQFFLSSLTARDGTNMFQHNSISYLAAHRESYNTIILLNCVEFAHKTQESRRSSLISFN